MNKRQRNSIIAKYKDWFKDTLIQAHVKNTNKLIEIEEFNINPFLVFYLAKFLNGNTSPLSVAQVLMYPRVLGTSITTSFGQNLQKFMAQLKLMGSFGSTTPGIDIEFIDQIDKRKKYAQLKAGPNVINKDDVDTINGHFRSIKNLAKTNHLPLQYGDLALCLMYGESHEINSFIKALQSRNVSVYIGKDFWHRFTGDLEFYEKLIAASAEVVDETNISPIIRGISRKLSKQVKAKFYDYYSEGYKDNVDG